MLKFKPEDFRCTECSIQCQLEQAERAQRVFDEWYEFSIENAVAHMRVAIAFLEDTLKKGNDDAR